MSMANAFSPDDFSKLSDNEQAMILRREKVLGPAYRLFYEQPIHFVRGEGVWLYDANGRAYLDAYNNVASVGHSNPAVLDAMARQASTLNTHTRYLHDQILTYAEKLTATFPSPLSQVMFTCTGSEANDLAVRIARSFTGGEGIIVTANAYHGVTVATSAFSPSLGSGVDLAPVVRTVTPPLLLANGPRASEEFAYEVVGAIADLRRHGIKPSMLMVDTIFSSDGVIADPAGFLGPAVKAIRESGGLFVADEVQPGFGRTGDGMWGFLRHGLVPDMVTVGKPMGNGYPMGGLIAQPEIIEDFGRRSRYFNTFGGNPIAAAAGQAVLDVITRDDLITSAKQVGVHLKGGIETRAKEFDALGEVRGVGLFIGVDILEDGKPSSSKATKIVNEMRRRGVLISASGKGADTLKIRPPLVFSRENADHFLSIFEEVMKTVSA